MVFRTELIDGFGFSLVRMWSATLSWILLKIKYGELGWVRSKAKCKTDGKVEEKNKDEEKEKDNIERRPTRLGGVF